MLRLLNRSIYSGIFVIFFQLVPLHSVASAPPRGVTRAADVSFAKDIRSLLSENCYKCHGPDPQTRAAGLRLDTFAGATQRLKSNRSALVPFDQLSSEVIERITLPVDDPRHMPPLSVRRTVKPNEVITLRRWIEAGGKYEEHWAYSAPRPHRSPKYGTNPIDAFINKKLASKGIKPNPVASKETLLRRVSLDLTGLPPSESDYTSFMTDSRPGAYERVVDRLLASPQYGERMALMWLDLSRYADTHGYHIDSHRDMFRWRDWVINAFNSNMPYDQFLTEQLAGDLLPNPTTDQLIATGFNRNHPINFEGGAIPEEYQTAYVSDRVDTTATVTMGLTLRCAQCHDHKYDPLVMNDYYRFFALFNNIDEEGLDGMRGNAKPNIPAPTPSEQASIQQLKDKIAFLETKIKASTTTLLGAVPQVPMQPSPDQQWVLSSRPTSLQGAEWDGLPGSKSTAVHGPGGLPAMDVRDGTTPTAVNREIITLTKPFSIAFWYWSENGSGIPVAQMNTGAALRGWDFYLENGSPLLHFINAWPESALRFRTPFHAPTKEWVHVVVTNDGSGQPAGIRLSINGANITIHADHNTLKGSIDTTSPIRFGNRGESSTFAGYISNLAMYKRELSSAEMQHHRLQTLGQFVQAGLMSRCSDATRTALVMELPSTPGGVSKIISEYAALVSSLTGLEGRVANTMIMRERPTLRQTFVLDRGQYDKRKGTVSGGVPNFGKDGLPGQVKSRLGLARWLTSGTHPLTGRVAVNRLWQLMFSQGIVRTSENFGVQGDWPSHPELLDWLATEYPRVGWNTKKILRLMVTSDTYKRSAFISQPAQIKDPTNSLLSHMSRPRLPAEFIRDMALSSSGLMIPDIGGPSVKTYQPAGLWEELSFKGDFTAQYFVQDHGEKLYRRSMYTFWKRTVPPPSLQTFDAPEREFCIVRRAATNTPLQALVLLNDPTYTEAARVMAETLLITASDGRDILDRVFIRILSRVPTPLEYAVFHKLRVTEKQRFVKVPNASHQLLTVGEHKRLTELPASEVASWTIVILSVMNLDEAITRP